MWPPRSGNLRLVVEAGVLALVGLDDLPARLGVAARAGRAEAPLVRIVVAALAGLVIDRLHLHERRRARLRERGRRRSARRSALGWHFAQATSLCLPSERERRRLVIERRAPASRPSRRGTSGTRGRAGRGARRSGRCRSASERPRYVVRLGCLSSSRRIAGVDDQRALVAVVAAGLRVRALERPAGAAGGRTVRGRLPSRPSRSRARGGRGGRPGSRRAWPAGRRP